MDLYDCDMDARSKFVVSPEGLLRGLLRPMVPGPGTLSRMREREERAQRATEGCFYFGCTTVIVAGDDADAVAIVKAVS